MSDSNALFYGDNLTVMQGMPAASVDLIYLDPPFNSKRSYNLLYKNATGLPVPEQADAFCDTWELDAEKLDMVRRLPTVLREYGMDDEIVAFWKTWMHALEQVQPRLLAYLIYMFYRLLEMRRLLKPTGSIYLHCDPTASHYIKVLMDGVFGHTNFRNEIVWHYTNRLMHTSNHFSQLHDTIFVYTRHPNGYYFEPQYDPKWKPSNTQLRRIEKGYEVRKGELIVYDRKKLERDNVDTSQYSKVYMKATASQPPVGNVWDIAILNPMAKERLGYPTQKPIALLDRIIKASCPPDGVVFDPFCGCGTTIYAAHLNTRRWIGCDIAILSVKLVQEILKERYGLEEDSHYVLDGIPVSVGQAQVLFEHDPFQFQHWAIELAGGFCNNRKGADRGIDGHIYFELGSELRSMVVSVKGGAVRPTDIRDLHGVMGRDPDCEMGAFISLREPSKGMREAAAGAGLFEYRGVSYDRIQLRTIAELLAGSSFETPSKVRTIHKEKQYGLSL